MNKPKIPVVQMETEIGTIPILSNYQKVNRNITLYLAKKQIASGVKTIFFIIRTKDVEALKKIGYIIYPMLIKKLNYPVAIDNRIKSLSY